MEAKWPVPLCVATLVVLAGCGSLAGTGEPGTQTTATTEQGAEPCVSGLTFFGLDRPTTVWENDTIGVSYSVERNASALLVVSENDTVVGVDHVGGSDYPSPVVVDAATIELDRAMNGTRTLQVTAYHDRNENEEFDTDTDTACGVEAGPTAVNFSAITEP